jgi:hypothetical protein
LVTREIRIPTLHVTAVLIVAGFVVVTLAVDVVLASIGLALAALYAVVRELMRVAAVPNLTERQMKWTRYSLVTVGIAALLLSLQVLGDVGKTWTAIALGAYVLTLACADELAQRLYGKRDASAWWSRHITLRLAVQERPWRIAIRRREGGSAIRILRHRGS